MDAITRIPLISFSLIILLSSQDVFPRQQAWMVPNPVFTHADTLRGMLSPERTCYDVRFYHLDIRIDPAQEFISGSNSIQFTVDSSFNRMQVDLFANLSIDTIILDGSGNLAYV